jgi:PAS domain-containing protein
MELTAVCKDGTVVPVEVSLSPVELDEGLLIATAIRDVSERKKLEAQLRDKERLAEMGKMAAIFAHEAANPLNGISTIIQLIKESIPAEYLGSIIDLSTEVSRQRDRVAAIRRRSTLYFETIRLIGKKYRLETLPESCRSPDYIYIFINFSENGFLTTVLCMHLLLTSPLCFSFKERSRYGSRNCSTCSDR